MKTYFSPELIAALKKNISNDHFFWACVANPIIPYFYERKPEEIR